MSFLTWSSHFIPGIQIYIWFPFNYSPFQKGQQQKRFRRSSYPLWLYSFHNIFYILGYLYSIQLSSWRLSADPRLYMLFVYSQHHAAGVLFGFTLQFCTYNILDILNTPGLLQIIILPLHLLFHLLVYASYLFLFTLICTHLFSALLFGFPQWGPLRPFLNFSLTITIM